MHKRNARLEKADAGGPNGCRDGRASMGEAEVKLIKRVEKSSGYYMTEIKGTKAEK